MEHFDDPRDNLIVLEKPVGCPGAQWPAPVQHLVSLVNHGKVLGIITDDLVYVHRLQLRDRGEIHDGVVSVSYAQLSLDVESSRQH